MSISVENYLNHIKKVFDSKIYTLTSEQQNCEYGMIKAWFNPWQFSTILHLKKNDRWVANVTLSAYPECCGAVILHNLITVDRRKGTGTLMLQIAEKVCKLNSYSAIHGIVSMSNIQTIHPAIEFFKKHGYTILKDLKINNHNTANWLIPIIKEI